MWHIENLSMIIYNINIYMNICKDKITDTTQRSRWRNIQGNRWLLHV